MKVSGGKTKTVMKNVERNYPVKMKTKDTHIYMS